MKNYHPFNPHPTSPNKLPPSKSCDSQFHVFGSEEKYPVRPGAAYEMPTATIAKALEMHRILGIERGVIVQATTYGADHQVVLDGLEVAGRNYRGCANAIVLLEGTDAYIDRLHSAGVRGARFTRQGLGITMSPADYSRVIGRVKELGWYVKFQPETAGIMGQLSMFEDLDMPVVIDHMGRSDVALGDTDPSFKEILNLLKRGNFWVMLSLSEKLSKTGLPWDDVLPLAHKFIEAAPDRMIWGSDWPHPLSVNPPPDEALLVNQLYRYAHNDDALIEKILVRNPTRLFGFEDY
jgi:predicted TIM-barrel fold metal-dependent hydrolase